MPIGEFGGAPPLVAEGSPALATPMYWMYEMAHASLNPARAVTDATKILFQNPLNPLSHTQFRSEGSPALATPMYWMYEMAHASLNPARAVTDATKILFQNPLNPLSHTQF